MSPLEPTSGESPQTRIGWRKLESVRMPHERVETLEPTRHSRGAVVREKIREKR